MGEEVTSKSGQIASKSTKATTKTDSQSRISKLILK